MRHANGRDGRHRRRRDAVEHAGHALQRQRLGPFVVVRAYGCDSGAWPAPGSGRLAPGTFWREANGR